MRFNEIILNFPLEVPDKPTWKIKPNEKGLISFYSYFKNKKIGGGEGKFFPFFLVHSGLLCYLVVVFIVFCDLVVGDGFDGQVLCSGGGCLVEGYLCLQVSFGGLLIFIFFIWVLLS